MILLSSGNMSKKTKLTSCIRSFYSSKIVVTKYCFLSPVKIAGSMDGRKKMKAKAVRFLFKSLVKGQLEKLTDILTSENEGVLFSQKEPGKI